MSEITQAEARAALEGLDFVCGYLGVRIEKGGKTETIYTPEEILGMEEGLAADLVRASRKINKPLQKEILGMLTKKDWNALTEKQRETIYNLAAGKLQAAGAEMGEIAAPMIRKEAERVYSEVRNVFSQKLGITSDFEAIDQKLIDAFARDNNFWIGKHYTDEHLEAVKRIGAKALEEGLGRDELASQFKAALGSQFEDYKYWDVLSSSVINRSRTYSVITSFREAGVTEYESFAMGDERTCPICRALHGVIFKTEIAYEALKRLADLENPENLKLASPWLAIDTEGAIYYKDAEGEKSYVDPKDGGQLQEVGVSGPPYHGKCRCDVVIHIRR